MPLTSRPRPYAVGPALVAALALALGAASCSGEPATTASSTSSSPSTASTTPRSSTAASSSPGSAAGSASSAAGPRAACVSAAYDRMSEAQRVGQLLMIGLDTNAGASSLDDEISRTHVGNVIYLGGWTGTEKVRATSAHLQRQATSAATGGADLLIAADQEGGQIRQLRGTGFSRIPSALTQGTWSRSRITSGWATWAAELKAVGINLDLAPVADTVPRSLGRGNAPIGKWDRQLGNDPATTSRGVAAAVRGMHRGGVEATLKHFPGLGRIRNNTDFASSGITDTVASRTDPYLRPFAAGIRAGAGVVMVGSARYPRLDPANRAMFSRPIVTGLLRDRMGFDGVVVTDDLNAASVRSTAPGRRAVLVIAAGGDIALSGNPADATPMSIALRDTASRDKRFAAMVEASVRRVLTLKARRGLLSCS